VDPNSIYVGFETGGWLQMRLLSELNDEQRERLRATMAGADIAINLVRPTESGELPMRRIFEDREANKVGQFDLWKYGYDPRTRFWYRTTIDRPLISSPYLAFTIGLPLSPSAHPCGVKCAACLLPILSSIISANSSKPSGLVSTESNFASEEGSAHRRGQRPGLASYVRR
jgi:adenylate cyclase